MKEVLFIQGAGKNAYRIDKLLADNLQKELGTEYKVHYPEMPDEENAPYDQWMKRIEKEINAIGEEPAIVVGHSIGASHLAKALTEITINKPLSGIFLLETPFWGEKGWKYEGYKTLEIQNVALRKFSKQAKIFLYHTRDDEVVPFDHLTLYAKHLPQATIREIENGGHQLNNNLSIIAADIKSLYSI